MNQTSSKLERFYFKGCYEQSKDSSKEEKNTWYIVSVREFVSMTGKELVQLNNKETTQIKMCKGNEEVVLHRR